MTSSSPETATKGPLHGITVLDFSRMLAGPYCTAMLADQGARVIKVEALHGDDQRYVGAFREGESLNFHFLNRGKESVTLDMRQPEGRRIAQELAAKADFVVENFRPGVAKRLGIDAETLRAAHPGLVYCSISGFGQISPMAEAPSYDVVAQALSGLMSVTGMPDGAPTLVGDSVGDIVSGISAAQAITAGLVQKGLTGRGTVIDLAMFDVLFSLLPTVLASWQKTGERPLRCGNEHPLSAPFGSYDAADEPVMIAVASKPLFATLTAAIGRPELAEDARFLTDELRSQNRRALRDELEGWTRARSAAEVVAVLTAAGVPVSRIWAVDEAANSEQARARGLLTEITHPRLGTLRVPEQPAHFAGLARGQSGPAPDLGADSAGVLGEVLGLSPDDISRLRAGKII
ncbi:CaiB/BaiF CoA transferase family protein [Paracoccus aminophilus]|uniref:CoA-transferase n=1 Tax=Paracoccus aminophilus JCM 7686 TaxID=1367847 RepID=S5Y563_PARAH|nr:CoA transferase [Paracoccus aminophilus]AGT10870.1 CoA-transferase [Paracoccus aminophilus JCM 7686]